MIEQILREYIETRTDAQILLNVPVHDPARDTSKFRMSDAGKCRLFRFLKRQGNPIPTPDFTGMMAMEAGNIIHSYIAHAINAAGYGIEEEGELEDEHRIGHFDLLYEHKGQICLTDVKSVSSSKMFTMKKYNNQPDAHHIHQVVTYFHEIQEHSPILKEDEHIGSVSICYINRDNWSEIRETEIDLKPLLIACVQDDWEILLECWNEQSEPKANAAEWECRFCPYRAKCQDRRQ